MVDMVQEKNVVDDEDEDDDDENMDNIYVEIVNVFVFDDIQELEEDNYMDKVLDQIYDPLKKD